jgi:hypothetical protein
MCGNHSSKSLFSFKNSPTGFILGGTEVLPPVGGSKKSATASTDYGHFFRNFLIFFTGTKVGEICMSE